jgi:hypothetical protein
LTRQLKRKGGLNSLPFFLGFIREFRGVPAGARELREKTERQRTFAGKPLSQGNAELDLQSKTVQSIVRSEVLNETDEFPLAFFPELSDEPFFAQMRLSLAFALPHPPDHDLS